MKTLACHILFIHQNFPGQFKHLAPALAARGHQVKALAITGQAVAGVELIQYKPQRGTSSHIHPWVAEFETKVIRGEACGQAMLALRQAGFTPDLIVAHPGWGESLFAKDVWPASKLLSFLEFYYASQGTDVGFDPEFARTGFAEDARLRLKNANNLLALEASDWGLSPTAWQRSSLPRFFHDQVSVIFDGIDTDVVKPNKAVSLQIGKAEAPDDQRHHLQVGDEVITFVNRNLEPYRGYHVFMRALPAVLKARPNARVLIVGGDGVSYGAKPPEGMTWKQRFLDEVQAQLDMSRVHFLGNIPYQSFLRLLQISACHVYLTYPFVLSWSCIEAMAAGCLIIGSRTPPVMEAIRDRENGLLVDFFDTDALSKRMIEVLSEPRAYEALRASARRDAIERYDLKNVCLPQQIQLVERLLAIAS
jgi:glycosyltransferase involved in cell wall biosynthesis